MASRKKTARNRTRSVSKARARHGHSGTCDVVERRYCFTSRKGGHRYRPCKAGKYSRRSYSGSAAIVKKVVVDRCRTRDGLLAPHNKCPNRCGY